MRDMNSPGMTLVLADREGVQRVATYGFSDLERQRQLDADELFQIGSITKSFLALVLLQLREEGKLDLHKPIVEYLPWFRIQSAFAPITTHHLLTHTSGLPAAPEVFPSDPAQRHIAAYAPGERFHYNNMAYALLGHLAWTLDGRELPEIFRERIFKPLGMSQSEPAIDFQMRERMPRSYQPFLSDRPYPRHAELCEAPSIISTNGCGLHRCARPRHGRVRPDDRQSRPWAERQPDFAGKLRAVLQAPHQGRGIRPECKLWLRHRGRRARRQRAAATHRRHGVIHVGDAIDIEAGIGAFASVNAQQGYRPNAVVKYALQLMRARIEARSLRRRRRRTGVELPTRASTSASSRSAGPSGVRATRENTASCCAKANASRCRD